MSISQLIRGGKTSVRDIQWTIYCLLLHIIKFTLNPGISPISQCATPIKCNGSTYQSHRANGGQTIGESQVNLSHCGYGTDSLFSFRTLLPKIP